MDLIQVLDRRVSVAFRISILSRSLLVAGLLFGAAFSSSAFSQVVLPRPGIPAAGSNPRSEDEEAISGVYLPTDRALSRAVTRARERLSDHEYHEALSFLQGILQRQEDSFLERTGDDRGQLGLKATARQLIGDLPPEGRDAYELLQGATARRQLEAAIKNGDRIGIANVVRQFFHTPAGYEATFVLAQLEADQGHRLAAAQLYQELIDTPQAADRFEPQLSIAAAFNELAAGRAEAAAAKIKALRELRPGAEIEVFGKRSTVPSATADPLTWLTGLVGATGHSEATDHNWLTLRGDPSRNVKSPGGKPHLRARWEARVVNEPSIESYLVGRSNDFIQRGVVAIPGGRPIAAGDVVVMRTPENVVAVDWQTGKRVWETRDEQELDSDEEPSDLAEGIERDQWSVQGKSLEGRMWDDALATALSSDGSRVFVVRGVSGTRDDDSIAWQIQPGFNRMGVESAPTTNQLAAYDLATQGKLAWELDGARTAGTLAGAFFLGPPVAIDNTLYVMAEVRSAVYLLALDPATGAIEWQQQLVGLEQGIGIDSNRRRVGAMPSYAGGILVCPTGASAAIAIDIVKREFAWVYRYPRESQSLADANQIWQQRQLQAQLVRANDQWLDNSAIIAENCVLLTPPESAEIHCLDLRTGKMLWKRRQGDALFVGAVDDGNVLLVGSQSIQALRLASEGAPAWKQESVPLPTGALPAGQGYLSEGKYYLPLTSGQIAEVNMSTGDTSYIEPGGSNVVLGNLICYRGSVISQSPLVLDKFERFDLLRKRTESSLAQNPRDPGAIRELAEIKYAAGDKGEAVRLLKDALKLAPDDGVIQEMLVELLLNQLSLDYAANRADVPLVARLVRTREQQVDLLRINAAGIGATGDKLAAWDAYLKLGDYTAEEPTYLQVADRYTVRSDRWISSQLAAIWASASAEERKELAGKIADRRPATKSAQTASELRHYLAHLGELPGTDDVRLALASLLIDRGRAAEAEIELLQLARSSDPEIQRAAENLLARSAEKFDKRQTARKIDWPRGHVKSELSAVSPNQAQSRERVMRQNPERQSGYRQLRIEQDSWPSTDDTHWFVAMDCSEIIGRTPLGDDVFHWAVDQGGLGRQYRDGAFVHGARLGHLLFFTLGGQVMAVDSRQDSPSGDGDLLWPNRSANDLQNTVIRAKRGALAVGRPSRPLAYHAWSSRKRIVGAAGTGGGALGPATPRGVVLQEGDELKCVEPLSGAVIWSRTDIPPGAELFGDSEFVFAADIGNRIAQVIRISDGELIGKRDLPKLEWLLTSGRNIAQLAFDSSHGHRILQFKITDILAQKDIYEAELPVTSRVSVLEPNLLAIFDPTGKFNLVDVAKGQVVIDKQLEPANDFQSIQTIKDDDTLFLFVSGQAQPQFKSVGHQAEFPLVNGPAYAFDLKTGDALWPGPALLRNRGVVLSQPENIPLLVLADRQLVRDSANGGGSLLRVLCLDKRTGQTVYRNDALQDTSATRFRVRGELDSQPAVALEMSAAKIQLTMTDRPRPPQPPANDDLEAPREIVERGLRGLGQRIGSALQGELNKPIPVTRRAVPGQPAPAGTPGAAPQPEKPPEKSPDKLPDTDD